MSVYTVLRCRFTLASIVQIWEEMQLDVQRIGHGSRRRCFHFACVQAKHRTVFDGGLAYPLGLLRHGCAVGPWYVTGAQLVHGGKRSFVDVRETPGMLFELRQYQSTPGNRANLVRIMEEEIIPFQVSKGMVILGSFVGEEDEDTYVWIRRFTDEAQRLALYDAVYQSDHWKQEIAPRIAGLLIREAIKVTRLTPTPKSPLQ
jgi:hypothetical protein